jgi:hypothetical protein
VTETEKTPSAAYQDEEDEDVIDKAKVVTDKAGDLADKDGEGDFEGAPEDVRTQPRMLPKNCKKVL